jgi:uncharacterized protein
LCAKFQIARQGVAMRIGFNFTLGDTYEMVQRMIAEGHIDYCEMLIDNFFCVPPAELATAFSCPVGFHIMFSRFLENDRDTLRDFARRLRPYIDALDPIYVSDHCAYFSHRGRRLFHIGEFDYARDYDMARERCAFWQNELGTKLLIENYPSIMDGGREQPEFFEKLERDVGTGVLFDASNAVCAVHNCGAPLERWDRIVANNRHFHVAGYRLSMIEPYLRMDTHAEELSPETLEFLISRKDLFDKEGATLTYERDGEIEYDSIVADLTRLRAIFPKQEAIAREPALATG